MVKHLVVYRRTTQYVSAIEGDTILWTHTPALALRMTVAQATALAERLQRSADMNGRQYMPPGEYGVDPLGVQETTP
jgi:hypothetical protein